MNRYLMLNNFLIALAITSQSSFSTADAYNTASTVLTEKKSIRSLENSSDVSVSLKTPINSTISFRQENDPDSTAREIPHLVLKRNGVLTPGIERTLLISVNHLSI